MEYITVHGGVEQNILVGKFEVQRYNDVFHEQFTILNDHEFNQATQFQSIPLQESGEFQVATSLFTINVIRGLLYDLYKWIPGPCVCHLASFHVEELKFSNVSPNGKQMSLSFDNIYVFLVSHENYENLSL